MNNAHRRREKRTSKVLELMDPDLSGKITPEEVNGKSYAQQLTDDYSGAMWLSCMSQKQVCLRP